MPTETLSARSDGYSRGARLWHWLTAGLLCIQIPLAYLMMSQPLGPAKLGNYALHKSLGLSIFALTALRLAWRLVHRPPPLPPGIPTWQQRLGRLNQAILYFLMFAMPLTGWLNSSAANMPVSFFGLFTLPNLVAPDPERQEGFEASHEMQAYVLFTLVAVHALAALHHHFVKRDGVLRSMLPRWS